MPAPLRPPSRLAFHSPVRGSVGAAPRRHGVVVGCTASGATGASECPLPAAKERADPNNVEGQCDALLLPTLHIKMSVEGGDTAQEQERTVAGPGDGQVDGTAEEPSVNGVAQQRATDDDASSRMAVDDECKGTAASAYTPVLTLRGHMRSVSSLSISPDGQQLASSGADGLLKLWSIATGALLATLDAASTADDEGDAAHLRLGISDVAWSKDGRYLVCGGDDCIVRVWDAGRVSAGLSSLQ